MPAATAIQWTEMTWNPVVGCTKISEGCKHCYAERMAKRLQAMGVEQYRNGFEVTLVPHVLEEPSKWRKPRMVFVNSMSDLFHHRVPLDYIQKVFDVMASTPQHTYQILTKRAERLSELASQLNWAPNIWMGVSIESQDKILRLEGLRKVDAIVRFISFEPLLGPLSDLDLSYISWVIVGGESGPSARPIRKSWIDSILKACRSSKVPFFFKQWGRPEFNVDINDPTISKNHADHAKGGCLLDGKVYHEMPSAQHVDMSNPLMGRSRQPYLPQASSTTIRAKDLLTAP
jgi:protein gp37